VINTEMHHLSELARAIASEFFLRSSLGISHCLHFQHLDKENGRKKNSQLETKDK
jgi:hypothetical protein